MNQAFEIAGVGLTAQQRALDIIANNIANINTLGFKRSDLRFVDLIASMRDASNPSALLAGSASLASVSARPMVMIGEQGEIEQTGRAMDLAIQGNGFVEVIGANGELLLWRGGGLSIQQDGLLATADGMALRAAIAIPADITDLRIDADGLVMARSSGSTEFAELGHIALVQVQDLQSLERLDSGLYRVADGAGLQESMVGVDGVGEFIQGAVERSNVQLSEEMVRLMLVQRAYAANAQIVQAADQLMAIANNLRK
jgi:flagellar basal-body rod protein FlgG